MKQKHMGVVKQEQEEGSILHRVEHQAEDLLGAVSRGQEFLNHTSSRKLLLS